MAKKIGKITCEICGKFLMKYEIGKPALPLVHLSCKIKENNANN